MCVRRQNPRYHNWIYGPLQEREMPTCTCLLLRDEDAKSMQKESKKIETHCTLQDIEPIVKLTMFVHHYHYHQCLYLQLLQVHHPNMLEESPEVVDIDEQYRGLSSSQTLFPSFYS